MKEIGSKRREFVKVSTLGLLGLAAGGGILFSEKGKIEENRLRPPGAVKEKDFLALCIKCGQCLQVCPYHSIKLADIGKGYGVGTPYIDSIERGCYACSAVPCVLACPSGALDHSIEKPDDIEMGVAVLESPETCLSVLNKKIPNGYDKKMEVFLNNVTNPTPLEEDLLESFKGKEGKSCSLCVDMCPIPNPMSAIAMIRTEGVVKPEIYEGCIGCGVCVEVCSSVLEQPAIIIVKNTKLNIKLNK